MDLRNTTLLIVKKHDVSKAKALFNLYGAVYPLSQTDINIAGSPFVLYTWKYPEKYEQRLLCDHDTLDIPDFFAITGMTLYDFPMVHIKQGDVYFTHECDQLGSPILAIRLDRQVSYDTAASFIATCEMIENFFSTQNTLLQTHLLPFI